MRLAERLGQHLLDHMAARTRQTGDHRTTCFFELLDHGLRKVGGSELFDQRMTYEPGIYSLPAEIFLFKGQDDC